MSSLRYHAPAALGAYMAWLLLRWLLKYVWLRGPRRATEMHFQLSLKILLSLSPSIATFPVYETEKGPRAYETYLILWYYCPLHPSSM